MPSCHAAARAAALVSLFAAATAFGSTLATQPNKCLDSTAIHIGRTPMKCSAAIKYCASKTYGPLLRSLCPITCGSLSNACHAAAERFPLFPHLVLDLRARDYVGHGSTWAARTGPSATVHGSPKFINSGNEFALFFDTPSQYASVPLNTDGDDMPMATYALWLKLPKAIPSGNNGWAMSQYPDHGWSRSITLNDPRLSTKAGVSLTIGKSFRNTLPKPRPGSWFHIVATWKQSGLACAYMNGRVGKCGKATNGHDGTRSKEQLILGGRGPGDRRHNPSVMVNDVRVYNTALTQAQVSALFKAGRDVPRLLVVNGPSVMSKPNSWTSPRATCPPGYVVTGLARVDIKEDNSNLGASDLNDFECTDAGCRAWCVGRPCAVRAQCIDATLGATSALTTATGPVVLSRKNQWGPYATCPPGYQVLSLARVDLLDQGSTAAMDLNDFECNTYGCRAWCTGSDCHVSARCGKAAGLSVVNGPLVRNKHDQWGSIARCPADYAAIGLARVNLLDQMKGGRYNPNQDVNDFSCSGDGCHAWCKGSDCTVQARCARVFALQNSGFDNDNVKGYKYMTPTSWRASNTRRGVVLVSNGNGPWGGLSSHQGSHFLSIQGRGAYIEQTLTSLRVGTTYEIKFMAASRPGYGNNEKLVVKVAGVAVWQSRHPTARFVQYRAVFTAGAAQASGSAVVRFENDSPAGDRSVFLDSVSIKALPRGLQATLGPVVRSPKNQWGGVAGCPAGYTTVGLGRLDLLDQTATQNMDVNDFQCDAKGCRAWCWGSDCNVQARCARAAGLSVFAGPKVRDTKMTLGTRATCPAGSLVLGLARINLLGPRPANSNTQQDVNDFICDNTGCTAFCVGSDCEVQALCGRAPGLAVRTGALVRNKKNTWGAWSACPAGFVAVGLARVDERERTSNGQIGSYDVNDFKCSGNGCHAWCAGADCNVAARCAGIINAAAHTGGGH